MTGGLLVNFNIPDLEAKVFEALGSASTCWETLEGAGVFNSELAKKTGQDLVKYIVDAVYFAVEEIDKSPRLGMATTEELIRELIARLGEPIGSETTFGLAASKRVFDLAFLLGSLPVEAREYRTYELR